MLDASKKSTPQTKSISGVGESVRTVGAVDPSDTVGEDVAGATDVTIRAVVGVGEMVADVGAFDVGDRDAVGPVDAAIDAAIDAAVGDVVAGAAANSVAEPATGEIEGAPTKHAS